MTPPITFGSVCSGIEAASVAWHPLGWRAAWLAEIEPFPCAVLARHYPNVPNLGDMTKIAVMVRDGIVPAPDVFCGGTPCQAFSIAGLRNSLDDARGNLSLTFCEIADEIDTRRAADGLLPSIVFWENVPGVLSTKDNAFGCFLAGLAGEDDPLEPPGGKWANAGCVFGPQRTVAWRVLDAQYFGVAQRRRRVFVVASAREGFDPTEVLFEFDGVRRDSAPSRETGQEVTGTISSRTTGGGGLGTDFECTGGLQPVLTCASNAEGATGLPFLTCSNIAKTVNNQTPLLAFDTTQITSKANRNNPQPGDPCHPLAAGAHPPAIAFDSRQDCVSSTEVFGALGSSSPQAQAVAFCQNTRDEVRLMNGDGQIVGALSAQPGMKQTCYVATCITGDITHTLKAEGFDASEDGTGRGQPIVTAFQSSQSGVRLCETHATLDANNGPRRHNGALVGMSVRRLTPRECERLQSFPDDYTLIPYGRVVKLEKLEADWIKYLLRGGVMTFEQVCRAAADGPRYKALGNSWCVYNVRWIGARIDRHLRAQSGAVSNQTTE